MSKVNYVPAGYSCVTPYLIVKGAALAIDFYKQVFEAVEEVRVDGPDGRIGHAELKIGDARIMLADEFPQMNTRAPQTIGGTPVSLLLYVTDVDAVVKDAVELGGQLQRPIEEKFYGDRMGSIVDPFGHVWHIATHIEDVPHDEMLRRAAKQQE